MTTTLTDTTTSHELFARAGKVIPGGVNSPVRAMRSVGRDYPIFVARGSGAHAWDVDGNQYVDWVLSWGALPFGHADPAVVDAIREAAGGGTSYGAPTAREVEMAELVCDAVPSIEMVRFVSSGTEAMMSAIRLARAATGRTAVITFSGCYHGHADPFLATGGSGLATLSIPSSPGVPEGTAADTLIARYNDLASVEALIAESDREIAAIILEPMPGNMGVVAPDPEFIGGVRAICDRVGALLIFDEVISGFRVAWGGAQELLGVTPDITALGKIVGGGLPAAAFGGRRDLMELIAPVGQVYQAGTLSGNPLAMAAGLAQLRALRDRDAYTTLEQIGARMETALHAALERAGASERCAIARQGSLVTIFHLGSDLTGAPRNFDEGRMLDTGAFACMHAGALRAGHLLPPSQYEALFGSTAHSDDHIDALAAAVEQAMRPAER
jgi:glutamate-1-semialdehyde 2,1-aminomutase